ncbi:MAG: hypothetical protein IPM33_06320 [Phycisphaerales bacterium]|nr:hypothetical protein [Phycisphaerales bacterium]
MRARSFLKLRSRRVRRRWFVVAGLVLSVTITLVLMGLMLTRGVPIWWRSVSSDDPRTRELGESLENGVVRQFSAVREPDPDSPHAWRSKPWAVSLHASDANAWVATRLPKWLANQERGVAWPGEISEVQIEFADEAVKVGMRVRVRGRDQVLSAEVVPEIRADGSLWMPATWVRVGRLPVPASWVLERAQEGGGLLPRAVLELPETREMFDIFLGRRPVVHEAIIGVDDARRVRLLKIVPRDGRLELTARTEAR